jgi:hypothetical protein
MQLDPVECIFGLGELCFGIGDRFVDHLEFGSLLLEEFGDLVPGPIASRDTDADVGQLGDRKRCKEFGTRVNIVAAILGMKACRNDDLDSLIVVTAINSATSPKAVKLIFLSPFPTILASFFSGSAPKMKPSAHSAKSPQKTA